MVRSNEKGWSNVGATRRDVESVAISKHGARDGLTRLESKWYYSAGTILERSTGFAIVHAGGTRTVDEVVFGEPGDMVLLGARSLEGLNFRVDPILKRLVDAGPAPAAIAC
jgi:hypothetical protein